MTEIREFILEMLLESSEVLIRMQRGVGVSNKSIHDLVTDADFASQKLIVEKIKSKFEDHTIFSEEGMDKSDLFADNCWVIDPLDGTNNYAYGLPFWGVSIAYAREGELIAGGIIYPTQKIILFAQKGEGAFEYEVSGTKISEGKKIEVSKRERIEDAMMLVCPAPHSQDGPKNFEILGKTAKKVFSIRQFGAAVFEIGYIAQGLSDIAVLFRLKPHDGAAGALIIEEAGGRVTDLSGEKWKLDSPSFLGSNTHLHDKILNILGDK